MTSLGSLGPRRRRSATNGVFGGLGAVPSKYWPDDRVKAMQGQLNTQLSAANCTTTLKPDGLIGPGTCGALAWAKARGAPPAAYVAAAADMDSGCKPFTPNAPACPASAGTSSAYGLPFTIGVKNDTVKTWQYMLNSELSARGIPTVPEDGVFNTTTCDAMGAFVRSYQADPNNPTPDDSFLAILNQYQNQIVTACHAMAQPGAVTTTAPAPTASGADLMKQQQTMLNTWLVSIGYQPIRVTGIWDGPTCGAGQFMTKTLPDTDPTKIALAKVLAQIKPLLGMPCGVSVQPMAPTRPPVAPPSSSQVLQMQRLLNSEVLRPGGYQLVPEDGRLAPATCGAASDTASATSIGRIRVSSALQSLLDHPGLLPACLPLKPWQFPQAAAPAAPPGGARSSALPPLNRDGECVVNFGQSYPEIGVVQQQLNQTLVANGFRPIPITNVWDAATCGALFELGGKFSPRASASCPHFYSVPLTCPSVIKPMVGPQPVKKPNIAIPLGIAALVGVSALVIAKKKGLIMAAKAAAPAV